MTDEQPIIIDLPHVAALTMATWIYLIGQNEEARDIIGNLADKLYEEMNVLIDLEDNNGQEGTGGSESDGAQSEG